MKVVISLRILHLLGTNRYSGAENVAINLAKLTSEVNEVFYCSPDGPIRKFVEAAGITFIPLEKESIREIKKVVDKLKPDLIHAHDFRLSAKCALIGKPFISHLHNNPPWLSKLSINSVVYLFAGIRAKNIICVSDSVMREYIFSHFVSKKAVTLHNIVDVMGIQKKGIPSISEYDVAFIGRQVPQKDPKRFVNIISLLLKKVPSIKAVMIGEGELFEEVKSLIIEKGLEDIISMKGFQNNPFPILKASKIVIMPSKWEGFGLTAVESMALGCPVLASPVGGLSDIVNDSCGKLCKTDNEFVDEANKLLENSIYFKSKSEKAVIEAKKYANLEKYKQDIEEIYAIVSDSDNERKVN